MWLVGIYHAVWYFEDLPVRKSVELGPKNKSIFVTDVMQTRTTCSPRTLPHRPFLGTRVWDTWTVRRRCRELGKLGMTQKGRGASQDHVSIIFNCIFLVYFPEKSFLVSGKLSLAPLI